jgi:hypothetical protein
MGADYSLKGTHMPRGIAAGGRFNIADLERILEDRRTEVNRLQRQLQTQWDDLARQNTTLDGAGGGGGRRGRRGGGGRARNDQSLADMIEAALRGNGGPMKVGDITEAVQRAGYRSGSANFRGIVNQMLIKDKRFAATDRGVYGIKGSGGGKKERAKAEAEG